MAGGTVPEFVWNYKLRAQRNAGRQKKR